MHDLDKQIHPTFEEESFDLDSFSLQSFVSESLKLQFSFVHPSIQIMNNLVMMNLASETEPLLMVWTKGPMPVCSKLGSSCTTELHHKVGS
ncbi:putative auxin efflux carrier component 1d [Trifolium repens]|nr:putative auxin efflux carrier component 1d [Trifolium repens]